MIASEDSKDSELAEPPALAPVNLPDVQTVVIDVPAASSPEVSEISIKSLYLYQIDSAAGEKREIKINGDLTDLNGYLKNLLSEIDSQEHKRSYKTQRETSEFSVALRDFALADCLVEVKAEGLAEKLLQEEIRVDKDYGKLNTNKRKKGLVNKGSFLQFLYEVEGRNCYLGVKIEHQVFFDENDFKKKSGLPESSKVYKACRVIYSGIDFEEISVYDKNAEPSVYWWSGFLELIVLRDDALNTQKAAKAIMKVLDAKVKKNHPEEYTQIRNAAIVALKQDKQINYYDLVDDLLKNTVFEDAEFNAKIPAIIASLKKAPEDPREGFDAQFQGVPSAVPYRRRRVELGRDIFISYPEDFSDLNDCIWAETNEKGEKLVIVKSEAGYDFFHKPS